MGGKADGRFELVIFDLDGVLVDSEPISARVTAAALTEAGIGISAAEVCDRFLGVSTAAMLRTLEAEHGTRLPESFQEILRASILKAFEHELEPVPGVAALLDALAVDRCVASSSHPARIRRSLELAGLLERFAPHLFSATMVSAGKPAPDLFLLAACRQGRGHDRVRVHGREPCASGYARAAAPGSRCGRHRRRDGSARRRHRPVELRSLVASTVRSRSVSRCIR